jgi:aquaporin Z
MRIAWKQCIAELIGTFALVFIGAGAVLTNVMPGNAIGLLGIAAAHGLALSIAVTATMHISGGHLNPAVTAAFIATQRMKWEDGMQYVVSQLVGASIAAFFLKTIYAQRVWDKVHLGTPVMGGGLGEGAGIFVEALLTFLLVFAVFGTAVDSGAARVGGFAIGLTLFCDVLMGGPLTGAAANPARAFGPALASGWWKSQLVYWIGPILGGCAAGLVYDRFLKK